MGISDGYRRISQKSQELWLEYKARFNKAGLPEPIAANYLYGTCRPCTKEGWACHKTLLEREGSLTDSALADIEKGLNAIRILDKVAEIRRLISTGLPVLDPNYILPRQVELHLPMDVALSNRADKIILWMAIVELKLDQVDIYKNLIFDARIQAYQIRKSRGDFDEFYGKY